MYECILDCVFEKKGYTNIWLARSAKTNGINRAQSYCVSFFKVRLVFVVTQTSQQHILLINH